MSKTRRADLIFRSRLYARAEKSVKIVDTSKVMTVKNAEEYADIIIRDERECIVSEKPTVYTDEKIERIYEFEDGAVVKYEWQNLPADRRIEHFNHKWTLITPPSSNPNKLKTGVVKIINY